MRSSSSDLRQAREFHESGNLVQAEQMYRRAVSLGGDEAYHWLARLLVKQGRFQDALKEADSGLRSRQTDPFCHEARGLALKGLGRLEDAIAAYRRAIPLDTGSFTLHYNLGNAYRAADRFDDARTCYRWAIRLDAGQAPAWNNLGDTYRALEQPEDSADAYRAALLLQPHTSEMLFNLGRVELDLAEYVPAARHLAEAAALRPGDFAAHYQLGNALGHLDDLGTAVSCYAEAWRLQPDDATIPYELGTTLQKLGRLTEAEAAFRGAVALAPEAPDSHHGLANLLHDMGRFDAAAAALDEALKLDPDHPGSRFSRALLNLTVGRLQEGFAEFHWGRKALNLRPQPIERTWNGEAAIDRTLLLYPEQGLGDFIQFSRFAPLAAQRVGQATLTVPPSLHRLFSGFARPGLRITIGPATADTQPHDNYCPVTDLPAVLGTTLQTIPPAPYLAADPMLAAAWRSRLAVLPGLRVGLAWAGNPDYPDDRVRSMRFAALAPILEVAGVSFVSLQQGGAAWTHRVPEKSVITALHDWTGELADFADTAALIMGLDLVISVDTSVAHLAGALGKSIWLINRFNSDWRWMRNRDDTPWYPSMRIFRQEAPGDWEPVMRAVRQALAHARPVRF